MPELFKHKKFQAGFVLAVAIFLGQLSPGIAETGDVWQALAGVNWLEVAAPVLTAIGAQGFADFGKERAKVER